nr:NAD-binding protein [Mycoplasmopsis bovis]
MDTVVVAVSDNIEIVAALLELNVKNLIVRAKSKTHARVLKQIGANVIIQPEYEAGVRTALIAANPNFMRFSQNLQEIGDNFVMGTNLLKLTVFWRKTN